MKTARKWAKFGLFAAAVAFSAVFFINYCDLVYQCGCTFLWAGAEMDCNIHNAHPPHCPWCANSVAGGAAFAVTIAAQAAAAWWPGPLNWLRVAGAFVASPLVALASGAVIGWVTGYWTV